MRIVKNSARGVSVSYSHNFGRPDKRGEIQLCAGFECSESGEIFEPKFQAGRDNLARCLAGLDGIVSMGIQRSEHSWYEAAIGECVNCKRRVTLSGFTNTCDCGADYNSSGQLLAPRSQWGEETGETASDILMADFSNERD
jgi:hypothetical protein